MKLTSIGRKIFTKPWRACCRIEPFCGTGLLGYGWRV
jgi:hypothetical protein